MLNILLLERLKNKRTITPKLIWIMPILVFILTSLLFASTGYVIESSINQWSLLWMNVFIALSVGLVERHEKNSTQYKVIDSSPIDLGKFELGKIMYGCLLSFEVTITFIIFTLLSSFIFDTKSSLIECHVAILGIFVASLWEVPLYTWLSQKTNLYISLLISFIGSLLGAILIGSKIEKLFPYTWTEIFPVRLIQMNVNGTPLKDESIVGNNFDVLIYSIILFIILSVAAAWQFKRRVIK